MLLSPFHAGRGTRRALRYGFRGAAAGSAISAQWAQVSALIGRVL